MKLSRADIWCFLYLQHLEIFIATQDSLLQLHRMTSYGLLAFSGCSHRESPSTYCLVLGTLLKMRRKFPVSFHSWILHDSKASTMWTELPCLATSSEGLCASWITLVAVLLFSYFFRAEKHLQLIYTSWVKSCSEGTLPFVPLQSRPILNNIYLLNNCTLSAHALDATLWSS